MRARLINEGSNILRPRSREEIEQAFDGIPPQKAFDKAVDIVYLSKIKELINNPEVDIHKHDDKALRWSAHNGHTEVVKVLLDAGADVHARSDEALKGAAMNGRLEVVKLLLDAGADVHAGNDAALWWALHDGHTEVVNLLKKYM